MDVNSPLADSVTFAVGIGVLLLVQFVMSVADDVDDDGVQNGDVAEEAEEYSSIDSFLTY